MSANVNAHLARKPKKGRTPEQMTSRKKAVKEAFSKATKLIGGISDYPLLTVYLEADKEPTEVANLPLSEEGCCLFVEAAASNPTGFFRTPDGVSIPFKNIAAIFAPGAGERVDFRALVAEAEPGPPAPPLCVRLAMTGQEVEIWNFPDNEGGRALLADLIMSHPRAEAATSDYGFVPLRQIAMR